MSDLTVGAPYMVSYVIISSGNGAFTQIMTLYDILSSSQNVVTRVADFLNLKMISVQ